MQLIDTHAHIYDPVFQGQNPNVLDRFFQQNGVYVLMPNIDETSIKAMFELHHSYPEHTGMLLGLHPCYVQENYAEVLTRIFAHLEQSPTKSCVFKGIGEIGLDLIRSSEYAKQQEMAFHQQLEIALEYKLPIVIHARESTKECLQIVKNYVSQGLTGIFHCFSGDLDCAREIVDIGFYLGIGGVISFKSAEELRNVVRKIGLKHLVLETDSPYLAPVPLRGKTNEPAYLHYIIEILAEILQKDQSDIALITTQNAQKIFKIAIPKSKIT